MMVWNHDCPFRLGDFLAPCFFLRGVDVFTERVQGPKMEVLYLIRLFWGWGFAYISRKHTAYMGEDFSILGT